MKLNSTEFPNSLMDKMTHCSDVARPSGKPTRGKHGNAETGNFSTWAWKGSNLL